MARDTQIVSSADHDAPKDYTIPGNAELILRAVQATFTDNGASGDWLPCVTLITDSGHTIARAIDRGVVITAGSDASVSWFPGVKAAAAAAGGLDQFIAATFEPYSLPSSPVNFTALTWESVHPASGTFVWPYNGDATKISITRPGIYSLWYRSTAVADWPTHAAGQIQYFAQIANWGTGMISQNIYIDTTSAALYSIGNGNPVSGHQMWNLPAGDIFSLYGRNTTAISFSVQITIAHLIRLGDYIPNAPI